MTDVLLVGAPNSGKSALFNRLTGLKHKVANYPGITIDVGKGCLSSNPQVTLWDFPGTYSLNPVSAEEQVAIASLRSALQDPQDALVAMVLDATRLEKGLTYCLQAARDAAIAGKAFVVFLNMMDLIESDALELDVSGLSAALGVPVYPVSARTGAGMEEAERGIQQAGLGVVPWADTPDALITGTAQQISERFAPVGDLLVRRQARLDQWLLGTVSGALAFVIIMTLSFQAILTWAAPLMDGVEALVIATGSTVASVMPEGVVADFVNDAIFGGLGAFLVFVPLVFILTLIIGALEDSGYLARAALICHRPLSVFGLSGKSFVPLLSGVACAIPAIYAAHPIIDAGTVADLRGDSTDALLGKTAGLCASHFYFDSQRDGTGWAHRLARSGDVRDLLFWHHYRADGCSAHWSNESWGSHRSAFYPRVTGLPITCRSNDC